MLLVQQFLQNKSFGDLVKEHGVYASFSKSGHKFSLNYDQIEAKESDPLAQECRGLVLAAEDGRSFLSQAVPVNTKLSYDNVTPGNTKVLAYPMRRFFNHGQGCAAEVNWSDPKLSVLEKLDGTLCILYYDVFSLQWCVATRSVPEADLLMDNGIFTFRTLFEKALKDTCGLSFDEFTSNLSKFVTYCFELTTPYNRIVVNYPDCHITLLAARRLYKNHLGEEYSEFDLQSLYSKNPVDWTDKKFDLCKVPIVKAYTYTSVSELLDWVSSLNPMDHEGVVVMDSQFNRIKVKNAAYVAYNKARDSLATSERNCLELILQEKDDDVKSFLPEEIVKNLEKIKIGFVKAVKLYDDSYQKALQEANAIAPGDKKTFAILVTKDKSLWSAPFFQIFDGKASSMKDFIQRNRKDGTWSDSFLDKLLEISKKSI